METKTELEQSVEAREQAKIYLEKAEGILDKAREVHDHTLSSQRKVAFAVSSLIGKPIELPEGSFVEDVVEASEQTEEQVHQRQEIEVINTLMTLAISNKDVLEIAVQYTAHVDWVEIDVRKIVEPESRYFAENRLLNVRIRLDPEPQDIHEPLEELLEVEDQLIELIAEAREEQEQNSEVAA